MPRTIPEVLRQLKIPVGIEIYLEHFPQSDRVPESGDDIWLPFVGKQGWIVISQDWRLHEKPNERFALKQYSIGCFYLWGAEAVKWEVLRCFVRGYDRIIGAINSTPRPFIYKVTQTGRLNQIPLP